MATFSGFCGENSPNSVAKRRRMWYNIEDIGHSLPFTEKEEGDIVLGFHTEVFYDRIRAR